MVMLALCYSCRPDIRLGGTAVAHVDPLHCYGSGDRPALRGTFGGFRCSCECRTWPRPTKEKNQ